MSPESESEELTRAERVVAGLLTTAAIAVPVVGIGMYWLLGLSAGVLVLATAIIGAFGFSLFLFEFPDDDDDARAEDEPGLHWEFDRPHGRFDWLKRFGAVYFTWIGLNCVINVFALGFLFHAPELAKAISSLILLALSIGTATTVVCLSSSARLASRSCSSPTRGSDTPTT